jgi:TetR/AcrR family transcriptional regulator, transcriptional repressor for nem operon
VAKSQIRTLDSELRKGSSTPAAADEFRRNPDTPYPRYLRALIHLPDKSKGQRTRDALLAAAAELLEEVGYRDLRVTDINERAGVSNALFYTYFENKEAISREVMTGFLRTLYEREEAASKPQSTEESIYRANLEYIRRFAANPGLMRCLLQFGDEIKEFGKLWRESNRIWLQRVVARLSREREAESLDVDTMWTVVSALGMMVDGMLRLVYIDADPVARLHAGHLLQEPQKFALFLTRLWVRGLFGRDVAEVRPGRAGA